MYYKPIFMGTQFRKGNYFMHMYKACYCSHLRRNSGNHAPKCLPFSILCAKSVIIHTSITYKLMKTGVGVNCNQSITTTAYLLHDTHKRSNLAYKISSRKLLHVLSHYISSIFTYILSYFLTIIYIFDKFFVFFLISGAELSNMLQYQYIMCRSAAAVRNNF